jgi:hypothetical protein
MKLFIQEILAVFCVEQSKDAYPSFQEYLRGAKGYKEDLESSQICTLHVPLKMYNFWIAAPMQKISPCQRPAGAVSACGLRP